MSARARGQAGTDCSFSGGDSAHGFYFVQLLGCHLVSNVSAQCCTALNYKCCKLADMIECMDAVSLRVTKKHCVALMFLCSNLNSIPKLNVQAFK